MAIEFVGSYSWGSTGDFAVVPSGTYTQTIGRIQGGIGFSIAEGDLLVITYQNQTPGTDDPVAVTGFTQHATQFLPSNPSCNVQVFYAIAGATPPTSVTVTGHSETCLYSGILSVWRGVDQTTPFDVSATIYTINAQDIDAPAITPANSGALVLSLYANGYGGDVNTPVQPSGMEMVCSTIRANVSGYRTKQAIAIYRGWTSGSYDPGTWEGGDDASSYRKAAAITMALRYDGVYVGDNIPDTGVALFSAAAPTCIQDVFVNFAEVSLDNLTPTVATPTNSVVDINTDVTFAEVSLDNLTPTVATAEAGLGAIFIPPTRSLTITPQAVFSGNASVETGSVGFNGGVTGGDPYWNQTVLAMHMDGTNGSTTFVDEKGGTITSPGYTLSTGTKKFGTASAYSGSGNDNSTKLDIPASACDFGSGDFTFETFCKFSNDGECRIIYLNRTTGEYALRLVYNYGNNGRLSLLVGNGSGWQINTYVDFAYLNDTNWHHVALTRSGSTFRAFVDGVEKLSGTYAGSLPAVTQAELFNYAYESHFDDVRITKGVARYTANFTAPTAAFPDTGPIYAINTTPTVQVSEIFVIPVGSGSLAVNNYSPTLVLVANLGVYPNAATLGIQTYEPVSTVGHIIDVDYAVVSVETEAPTLEKTNYEPALMEPASYDASLLGQVQSSIVTTYVKPATGSLTATGSAGPTFRYDYRLEVPTYPLNVTGQNYVVGGDHWIIPPQQQLTVYSSAPTLNMTYTVQPGSRALAIVGNTPTLAVGPTAYITTGQVSVQGGVPTVGITYQIEVPSRALATAGVTPFAVSPQYVYPPVGALAATGQPNLPYTSVFLDATGFANTSYVGTPSLGTPTAVGITPTLQFGLPVAFRVVQFTNVVYPATSVAPTLTFGTPTAKVFLTATSFSDGDQLGTPKGYRVGTATGLALTIGIGTPKAVRVVYASSVVTTAAFGVANSVGTVIVSGFANTQRFGRPKTPSTSVFPWSHVTGWLGPRG
jgi:hypothetical protein